MSSFKTCVAAVALVTAGILPFGAQTAMVVSAETVAHETHQQQLAAEMQRLSDAGREAVAVLDANTGALLSVSESMVFLDANTGAPLSHREYLQLSPATIDVTRQASYSFADLPGFLQQ